MWNSLPIDVVHAESTNIFKSRLGKFWSNQEIIYDYHAEIQGTGSRSVTYYWPPNGSALFCSLSSVVVCNAGAWAVGRPTLHGGPVRLRPVMATPCQKLFRSTVSYC